MHSPQETEAGESVGKYIRENLGEGIGEDIGEDMGNMGQDGRNSIYCIKKE